MELPFDPVIPLLGICPRNTKMLIRKNISTPIFIAVLFRIAQIWELPQCPSVDEWIKKLWNIYTMEFYVAVTKKELLTFGTAWMNLENIMLSEISQRKKNATLSNSHVESNERNRLMNEIKPEAWIHGTV